MDDKELRDRLSMWLNLEPQAELPPPRTPLEIAARAQAEAGWNKERLAAVAEMEVSPGINEKPAADLLRQAVVLVKAGASALPQILALLKQVWDVLKMVPTTTKPDDYVKLKSPVGPPREPEDDEK